MYKWRPIGVWHHINLYWLSFGVQGPFSKQIGAYIGGAEEAVRLVIRVTMAFSSAVFEGRAEASVSTADLSNGMLERAHFTLPGL